MEIPGDAGRPPQASQARARDTGEDTEAHRVAQEFEAVFLSQAVEHMMSTVDSGIFGGGHAEETWRGFMSRAFAEEIAGSGTTGIAASIETAINAYRARTTEGASE
ncbi:rod-binding protein [Histidinibacterium aquaticum]|uniref:Flagellar protein FlgJ N-terminal domain-containing protein n=1 Tax=Histidinibacterium aquaticum TaxID=2613962 RepID=A0A5J5GNK7_9RHOB|nr:rod-binding protein [Histidinibacterium aquaticum]KAA9009966.1 hypothetical protein F3S47_01500 [Histidinibacterium aquaticum]